MSNVLWSLLCPYKLATSKSMGTNIFVWKLSMSGGLSIFLHAVVLFLTVYLLITYFILLWSCSAFDIFFFKHILF